MKAGDQIQGYEITDQIAVGGFGTVWRVRHLESGHIAAIKILHAYLVSSEILVRRFEREARAIALMHHRNIVELYTSGRLPDGCPYLIMEFLDGVDLGVHITRRGTLPPSEICEILEQLGAALSAAHSLEIIHRDLKASNVFLSHQGDNLRVVLFDFGIAKLLGHEGANLTMSSSLVGSPACMSPEQILGRDVDARTDVYALGSLTYQMLVGHPPFSGASPTAILTMHLDDYPPYPSIHGDVSPAFDQAVMKAMSKEPGERFQDVQAFVTAFEQANTPVDRVLRASRQAPVPTENAPAVPALGLYIDVGADPQALEDPEDTLLDDMESIIPRAAKQLEDRGYLVAYERVTSALLVHPLPIDRLQAADIRRDEISIMLTLFQQLEKRPHRDNDVRLRLYIHIGEVLIEGDEVESLSPMDASDWTPALTRSGVFASDDVLAGMDLELDFAHFSISVQRFPSGDSELDRKS